jgi:RNA polymerase sigma-70 factor, ECF subfamily
VSLSEIDRQLLDRCLEGRHRAWEDFVDRFLGLVVHVVDHTTTRRGRALSANEREDFVSEVFLAILRNDLAVLRRFRRQSSLATYLTVIARRVVVHTLLRRNAATLGHADSNELVDPQAAPEARIDNRDQVEQLLKHLQPDEATIVRLYHLEGMSYQEISRSVGVPENSIGPMLSRARARMRASDQSTAHG